MANPAQTASDLQPYPEYKPSGVEWLGKVPVHWEEGRLGNSVQGCITGIWGNDPNGRDDLICVRVADFDRTRLRIRLTRPTLRAITHSERRQRLLTRGDLLLEKSGGGDLQPVGAVMLYDHDDMAVCSNFVARMPVSSRCSAKFLVYLHAHLYAIRLTIRSIKQTTGIQNLSSNSYLSETVAYPPIAEQAAIARYLDNADRRIRRCIQAKEKLVKLLEEQRQALINEAVTGRVDVRTGQPYPAYKPSGVEWLGAVPAHWDVPRLSAVGNPKSITGQQHLQLLSVYLDRGVIRFSEAEEKRTNVTSEDLTQYQVVAPGDLVLNNQQAWRGSVGVSNYSGIVSPAYLVMSLSRNLISRFANLLFRDQVMVNQYIVCSRGVGTIQRNLYWPHLKRSVCPLPPLPEQAAIARYLDHADERIRRYIQSAQRQIDLLKEYRTRLVADVVTGKLDVRQAVPGLANDLGEPEVITGPDASAVTSGDRARNLNAVTQASEA